MLNIPNSIKALYQTDGVRKNFRVHFPNGEYSDITNENIVQESLRFTESLCSQSTFKFGLAEASVLEFETVGIGNMYGMTIETSIEIDTSSLSAADITAIQADEGDGTLVLVGDSDIGYGFYRIPFGVFRIDGCPRDHQSMAHRKVTAYSIDKFSEQFQLPTGVWSSVQVDTGAIFAFEDPTYRTDLGNATLSNSDQNAGNIRWLFDSSNRPYKILPYDAEANSFMVYEARLGNLSDRGESYAQINYSGIDKNAFETFGQSIVQALNSAGLSLIYDGKGNAVYANNEEALRDVYPILFNGIAVTYFAHVPYNTQWTVGNRIDSSMSQPVPKSGQLMPVVTGNGYKALTGIGSNTTGGGINIDNFQPYLYISAIKKNAAGNNVNIKLRRYNSVTAQTGYTTVDLGDFATPVGTDATFSVKLFGFSTAGEKLVFYPSNTYSKYIDTEYRTSSADISHYKEMREMCQYLTGTTWHQLISGNLEIHAYFGKNDRLTGNMETYRLDKTAPVSVLPDNYEEMWWDEYDVDAIGTVTITFKDTDEDGNEQENTASITIGIGASRYDIRDNSVMKNLASLDYSSVSALVKNKFAPYVGAVAFTPIDLTMQGWPWLEAGDALEVEAEDGTIVESYALRIEMNGIQHLQMAITAEGGEIIEEVS